MLFSTSGKKWRLLLFIIGMLPLGTKAQSGDLNVGPVIGWNYSRINSISNIVIPEQYFINYTKKDQPLTGIMFGAFADYRFSNVLSGYLETSYSRQRSRMHFDNLEKDYLYDMDFNYAYMNMLAQLNVNIDFQENGRLYFGPGVAWGINWERNRIEFNSYGSGKDDQAFGTDNYMSQELYRVLHGRNDVSVVFGVGYVFKNFGLEGRVFNGLNDLVKVDPNSYNFVPNFSRNQVIQVSLKYFYNLKSKIL